MRISYTLLRIPQVRYPQHHEYAMKKDYAILRESAALYLLLAPSLTRRGYEQKEIDAGITGKNK